MGLCLNLAQVPFGFGCSWLKWIGFWVWWVGDIEGGLCHSNKLGFWNFLCSWFSVKWFGGLWCGFWKLNFFFRWAILICIWLVEGSVVLLVFLFFFFGSLLLIVSEYLSLIMVLYMFLLVWMLRKWNKRKENLEFLGNHVLGGRT